MKVAVASVDGESISHHFGRSQCFIVITGVTAEELLDGIDMIEDRKQIFDHMHGNSVVFTY
jgi:predicted Fe-Mo cluster-binding NifX family protein